MRFGDNLIKIAWRRRENEGIKEFSFLYKGVFIEMWFIPYFLIEMLIYSLRDHFNSSK